MEDGQPAVAVVGNPDWMRCLPEELLDLPLWNLALPGSHDSMAFCLDVSSPVVRSESRCLRVTDRFFPCWTRPCVYRWATTQEALGELALWLDAHPKEIVVVSCSHFEALTDEDHTDLVEFIMALLGAKLCSPQDTPTLRSCWSRGQQVILSYDDQQVVQQHPELWSGIPYWYADSPDPKKVIAYLEDMQRRGRPAGFYVCGLNLTEDICYVVLHPLQDMRKMTMEALLPLLRWMGEQQPGPEGGGVNIVCCDFVGMSEFCSLVIGLNYKLVGGACRMPQRYLDVKKSGEL
ncbi:PI-PLC X domain-containing protein 1-like isoform 3-T3 [Pholidichthys leucotaenia]